MGNTAPVVEPCLLPTASTVTAVSREATLLDYDEGSQSISAFVLYDRLSHANRTLCSNNQIIPCSTKTGYLLNIQIGTFEV